MLAVEACTTQKLLTALISRIKIATLWRISAATLTVEEGNSTLILTTDVIFLKMTME